MHAYSTSTKSNRLAALTTEDFCIGRATIRGERRVTIGTESSRKFSWRIVEQLSATSSGFGGWTKRR